MENEAIRKLAREHELDRVVDAMTRSLSPAVRLSRSVAGEPAVGASKQGGLPDFPPGLDWPHWNGRPLGLLIPIRCADLAGLGVSELLPRSGMLYFFYDVSAQPWGFDPHDRGGARVLYSEVDDRLARAPLPVGVEYADVLLPAYALDLRAFQSLPVWTFEAEERFGLTDEDGVYFQFIDAFHDLIGHGRPRNQLLGYPDTIQNDMKLECQLVSNGIHCGYPSGFQNPRRKLLEPGATQWRLLLQFDTDEEAGILWGDAGMVYF